MVHASRLSLPRLRPSPTPCSAHGAILHDHAATPVATAYHRVYPLPHTVTTAVFLRPRCLSWPGQGTRDLT
eukprot:5675235-Prymnesium_polylepis.1